jgi:hypothetical protein
MTTQQITLTSISIMKLMAAALEAPHFQVAVDVAVIVIQMEIAAIVRETIPSNETIMLRQIIIILIIRTT